jgi:phage terminase large subunit-like protein
VGRPVDEKDYCAIAKKYATDVVSGKIPACKWIKLACQRQLDDLQRKDWRWKWDRKRAARICKFIEKLPHIKGRWKTKTITLEPWQIFHLTAIFGWVDGAGLRRFRKALIVVPRKNAKTTEAAGVGAYLFALDGEPGAEVYSAATTRDQAKISWEIAKKQIDRSPEFRDTYGINCGAHAITIDSDLSVFKPLSRDADSLEGLNPHGAIIDELHAHKTREVFDVIDEATGARTQPLLFMISTEGDDGTGVFAEQVAYGQQILEGNHEDDTFFAVYYTIDPEDDWTSPVSWRKANPNLGVSVFERDFEVRCKQAIKNAASQASFKTKRLNIRVGAASGYFNMLAWHSICKDESIQAEDFIGSPCIMALDLASKRDITSRITVFRQRHCYYVFGKHYLPSDAAEPGMPNYDLYRGWAASGHLVLTDGNVTDYDRVEADVIEDARRFKPEHVGVDPNYNAVHLTTRLQNAGVPMIEVPQTVRQFSEPMKQLDALIVAGQVKHGGDPVLAWAMGNVTAKRDLKENVYPRKDRDEAKIDPAVALIGAMSVHLRNPVPISAWQGVEVVI